jgi:hypothetical protein
MEVRLHGALWRSASSSRADEWRRALDELNTWNQMRARVPEATADVAVELARRPDDVWEVRVYGDGVRRDATVELPGDVQSRHVADYATTIAQLAHMDREAPVRGFEALDYAKRVVHDDAAQALREALAPAVEVDLADARRLFTLLFLVATDLPEELVRFHRFHR